MTLLPLMKRMVSLITGWRSLADSVAASRENASLEAKSKSGMVASFCSAAPRRKISLSGSRKVCVGTDGIAVV
jgi:hypothetical protein